MQLLVAKVKRRWKLIFAVWLAVFLPVAGYAVTAVPKYTSLGALQVGAADSMGASNPLTDLMRIGPKAQIETEVEILKRRQFRAATLASLGLQIVDPNQAGFVTTDMAIVKGGSPTSSKLSMIRAAVDLAEVPEGKFSPTKLHLSRVGSTVGVRVEDSAEVEEFSIGETFEHNEVRLRFKAPPLPDGESMTVIVLSEGDLLRHFDGQIGVAGLGTARHPTNIVEVAATHSDRQIARSIVQKMMENYLAQTLAWQSKAASQAAEFIESQLEEVRTNLRKSEEKLLEYAQKNEAIQLDTQAQVAIENAAELEAQRVAIAMQEKTIGSVLSRIKGGRGPKASLTSNFFDDPVLSQSIGALTEAETQYEMLSASLTADHPQVQTLRRVLDLQRREVAQLMRSAQRNLASQKQQITEELESSMESMSKYPDKQIELARLTRDMEVGQRLYTLLLEKLEESEILKASTTIDKRIVDNASLPHRKASPIRRRVLAFGALGGLLLGISAALAAHMIQRRLDTVEAVKELVPFPTYGTVPELALGRGDATGRLTVSEVWKKPHEALPESFRGLGVSVSLLPKEAGRGKLLVVTSSQPGEGKSTIASNLAESLGRAGKTVLLVDLDLRKPVQHRLWGLARAPGYSDLLGQGGEASDVTKIGHKSEHGNTTVLTAGTRLPDTVAAVMTPSLESMLAAWLKSFDYVLIDSPPAFVAESVALAQHADLVLLVSRPGVIERSNLHHAMEALGRVDVPKGLVLNAVSRKHSEYYYGSGYYYYGTHYGEADPSDKAASA